MSTKISDITADGRVNVFDLLQFRRAYGLTGTYNPDFDFGNDGQVNIFDLLQFRNRLVDPSR